MLLVRVIMVINPSPKRLGLEIRFEAPTQKVFITHMQGLKSSHGLKHPHFRSQVPTWSKVPTFWS